MASSSLIYKKASSGYIDAVTYLKLNVPHSRQYREQCEKFICAQGTILGAIYHMQLTVTPATHNPVNPDP